MSTRDDTVARVDTQTDAALKSIADQDALMGDETTGNHTNDWRSRLQTWLPVTFAKARKSAKEAIAMLIGTIMTLDTNCRNALGQASMIAAIFIVFFFPSRTVGVVIADVIIALLGALIGSAWSLLGMYLASLARDKTNPVPIQPPSSGVLVVFLFIGTFVFCYIRTKFPQFNFACIAATILCVFSLTQCSMIPMFMPELIWTFLKPISLAGGISVGVSMFIWPEDGVSNFVSVFKDYLDDINNSFRQNTRAFLTNPATEIKSPLHATVSEKLVLLIDSKRAVHREIHFSLLSGRDVSQFTKIAKSFTLPLSGLELSLKLKADMDKLLAEEAGNTGETRQTVEPKQQDTRKALEEVVGELQPLFETFLDVCERSLTEAVERLAPFQGRPKRSTLNSILWPFPRLFASSSLPQFKPVNATHSQLLEAMTNLEQALPARFEMLLAKDTSMDQKKAKIKAVHILALYQFNINEYAKNVARLLEFIQNLEHHRTSRRLHFFTNMTVRKWFRPGDMDADFGGEFSTDFGRDGPQMTLVRTNTRNDNDFDQGEKSALIQGANGRLYYRDPDVEPPATAIQRFFLALYHIRNWFVETNTFFAFKTAVGTVLLALPVYLPQSAGWYMEYRGMWALFTLTMWMFPTAGMFYFSVIMRIVGTILGGVLGGVVWEISRGNPYGLGVLSFFCFWFLYHIFFYQPLLRLVAIMVLVTMSLVMLYEFQFSVSGQASYEGVWEVAGKRILLATIGVVAAAILSMIPYQVTGRVELRKQLAQNIRSIGSLHNALFTQLTHPSLASRPPTPEQVKNFRRQAIHLNRQITEGRTMLKLSVFEPPLRGRFPSEKYALLLDLVDSMAYRVYGMAQASQLINPEWRVGLTQAISREGLDVLASIATTIKLLSATLMAKMSLPPYMIGPGEARVRLMETIEDSLKIKPEIFANPSYLPFCTYVVNNSVFISDTQRLLEAVEGLVGVEDPDEWLKKQL